MKILSLDIGSKFIGVALSGESKILVDKYYLLKVKNKEHGSKEILKIIANNIDEVIIGNPTLSSNKETHIKLLINYYKEVITTNCRNIALIEVDESYSSDAISIDYDGDKGRIDHLVAKSQLEEYLKTKNKNNKINNDLKIF